MDNKIPYDLMTIDAENGILKLLNESGLAITTISLIIDKIKTNIDIQKNETINQQRIKEETKKAIESTIKQNKEVL